MPSIVKVRDSPIHLVGQLGLHGTGALGLALHCPIGIIFTPALLSSSDKTGLLGPDKIVESLLAHKFPGDVPKEHLHFPPVTTASPSVPQITLFNKIYTPF